MPRGGKKRQRLKAFAAKLNENLPRSEVWFQKLWKADGMENRHDSYNRAWCKRIPDVLNHHYRYVIEIDGSVHSTVKQKATDEIKDRFYKSMKYRIFRLKAFDLNNYQGIKKEVAELREYLDLLNKPAPVF